MLLAALLSFAGNSHAVKLKWDAPDDTTNVAGYKIYYGVSSGDYTDSVDAGFALEHEILGLAWGSIYHFTAVAYGVCDGVYCESEYSNEVVWSYEPTLATNGHIAWQEVEEPSMAFDSLTSISVVNEGDVGVPANTLDGDLLITILGTHDDRVLTPPAGWTVIEAWFSNTECRLYSYYRIADNEPASYNWDWTTQYNSPGQVVCLLYKGMDGFTLDGSITKHTTSLEAPAVTTVESDSILLYVGMNRGYDVVCDADMTERYNGTDTLGNRRLIISDEVLTSSGSTGTRAATTATSNGALSLMFAMEIEAAGGLSIPVAMHHYMHNLGR